MTNFLRTANPFQLATPPAWFLQRLWAYDSAVVIFPSTKEPLYRIGRRGKEGHGLLRTLKSNPDTTIYVENRLWPWKSILPQAVGMDWNRVLLELPQYDTQRFASGEDAADAIDAIDEREEAAIDRKIASDLDAMGHDTYQLFKMLEGSRVSGGARPEGAGFKKFPGSTSRASRQSSYRPTGAGTGAMFVGR